MRDISCKKKKKTEPKKLFCREEDKPEATLPRLSTRQQKRPTNKRNLHERGPTKKARLESDGDDNTPCLQILGPSVQDVCSGTMTPADQETLFSAIIVLTEP